MGYQGTVLRRGRFLTDGGKEESMRSVLLWLIGVPLPIILIIWLATGHS